MNKTVLAIIVSLSLGLAYSIGSSQYTAPSELYITSPHGRFQIQLVATDDGCFIIARDKKEHNCAQMCATKFAWNKAFVGCYNLNSNKEGFPAVLAISDSGRGVLQLSGENNEVIPLDGSDIIGNNLMFKKLIGK